jgi:hypothetical protein
MAPCIPMAPFLERPKGKKPKVTRIKRPDIRVRPGELLGKWTLN